ncbi:MAG: YafY family transcriptional regulator [Solirubrobacterales bacterium]|nr:YafY family transcriptional regulator [Solirubrobacterales bacterium]
MSRPATRLLAFLELLESSPVVSGRQAALELGVDVRTIRRYAVALEELGVPVEGQRGTDGGYRLRPGHRLPPLMLGEDEATAVVFGLVTAQRLGLTSADDALAKVRRVLPATVRSRVEALESAVAFTTPAAAAVAPDVDTLLVLAEAARRHRCAHVRYTPPAGAARDRELHPYGVVVHGGRWYTAARDAASGKLRTFRVDRLTEARLGEPAAPPPPGFDAVAHVTRSLVRIPYAWQVEVLVDAPVAALAERIPPTLAELTPTSDGGTRLRMGTDSLTWAAEVLAGLGAPLTVVAPEALRAGLREVAARLLAAAG